MPSGDPDRLLSMSAFEAAFVLRSFRQRNPAYLDEQLVETIRAVRSDFYPNDYEAGLTLERLIPAEVDLQPNSNYFRVAIDKLIDSSNPLWVRLAPGGREHVLQAVSRNGAQCFRNAGLLETPPSKAVADWWDALAARVRSQIDTRLLEQGREAERLSFVFECERLRELNIEREPRWTSIEDNNAGYDILSYNPGSPGPTNRLIEVKSSTQNPPRMILTRGEWEAAIKYGEAYVFHLWMLPTNEVIEYQMADIAAHIPVDKGSGVWGNVEIVFNSVVVTKT
jgi:hypothetical protein